MVVIVLSTCQAEERESEVKPGQFSEAHAEDVAQ